MGWLKCNTDAALLREGTCVEDGMILRNEFGAVIRGRWLCLPKAISIREVECFGLREVILCCTEL